MSHFGPSASIRRRVERPPFWKGGLAQIFRVEVWQRGGQSSLQAADPADPLAMSPCGPPDSKRRRVGKPLVETGGPRSDPGRQPASRHKVRFRLGGRRQFPRCWGLRTEVWQWGGQKWPPDCSLERVGHQFCRTEALFSPNAFKQGVWRQHGLCGLSFFKPLAAKNAILPKSGLQTRVLSTRSPSSAERRPFLWPDATKIGVWRPPKARSSEVHETPLNEAFGAKWAPKRPPNCSLKRVGHQFCRTKGLFWPNPTK